MKWVIIVFSDPLMILPVWWGLQILTCFNNHKYIVANVSLSVAFGGQRYLIFKMRFYSSEVNAIDLNTSDFILSSMK